MIKAPRFMRDGAAIAIPGNRRGRPLPWFVAGLGLPLISIGFLVPDTGYNNDLRLDQALTEIKPVFTLPLLFNSADLFSAGGFDNPSPPNALTLKVRRGDTLDRLFRRENLDLQQLAAQTLTKDE